MANTTTIDRLKLILSDVLALSQQELDAITPETRIADLGSDSLDSPQIVIMIEDDFDIDIEADFQPHEHTFADLLHLITEPVT